MCFGFGWLLSSMFLKMDLFEESETCVFWWVFENNYQTCVLWLKEYRTWGFKRCLGSFVSMKTQHPKKWLLTENSNLRKKRRTFPKCDRHPFGPICFLFYVCFKCCLEFWFSEDKKVKQRFLTRSTFCLFFIFWVVFWSLLVFLLFLFFGFGFWKV